MHKYYIRLKINVCDKHNYNLFHKLLSLWIPFTSQTKILDFLQMLNDLAYYAPQKASYTNSGRHTKVGF